MLTSVSLQISASVKRISQCDGMVEPKYSTHQAVERKVGVVPGWEELLMATGFHFIYQIKKDVPTTIVYPEHDDSGIQRRCQQQLEALLNIPHCLRPLSSLAKHPPAARPLLATVSCHPLTSSSAVTVSSLSAASLSEGSCGHLRRGPEGGQSSTGAWHLGYSWVQ